MSAADWLSLPAADLPGHAGDWQIELLLLGGVMRNNGYSYTVRRFDGPGAKPVGDEGHGWVSGLFLSIDAVRR
jgi:hypothetical protein